jgi:CDP-diacylglycerol--glycerol-3-phosphate 3-phosphatidyltransferase
MNFNIPNLLSLYRIGSAPFLLLSAYMGSETFFFIFFLSMLLSDALDGLVARILNQTSALGARLDSYGDIATYLSVPVAVWWLWPEIIKDEKVYIIVAVVVYVLPAFFSLAKFGQLASYHTWITKLSAGLMSLGVILLLLFHSPSVFHIAIVFLIVEAVENIAITLVLSEPKSDIRSFWDAHISQK